MLLELIIALNLKIIFTEKPNIDCGFFGADGCYYNNTIYLDYKSGDINKTLYHELGHAIFDKDKNIKIIIKDYELLKDYTTYVINGENVENEIIADYFAEFMINNKKFSIKYPCLWIYFNNKIKQLI